MRWEDEGYTRRDDNGNIVSLEEYEQQMNNKHTGFAKIMSANDLKLYAICGVGFMLDAYDLFIINLVTPIWTFEYFGGLRHPQPASITYPFLLRGAVNAAANIGNVIGQISFGFLGDALGRKFVYGKELIIAMIGIILVISVPNSMPNPNKFWYLFGMRIILGIGIGGDYPMSAAVVAERTTLRNRGRMLAWIFSNQGWGNLAGSIVTLCVLGAFSPSLKAGNYGKLDGVWRTQIGLALVPCAITLYFRLTMPESKKFTQSTELTAVNMKAMDSSSTLDSIEIEKMANKDLGYGTQGHVAAAVEARAEEPQGASKWGAFAQYFSEWRHLKVLIGTASTWFLVDVAFYGINLNQSVLLGAIGFTTSYKPGVNEYQVLLQNTYGNLIIAAAGYVPGYFFTIAFIEILGRKWIQIQGFLICALCFAVLAGDYNNLGVAARFVLFTLAQFFFNFGPNATTFIVPGEIFPSRVRGLAHGMSAAIGKLGAILSGLLFNYLGQTPVVKGVRTGGIGITNVLWIFFACNLLGAVMTFFFVPESKGVDSDAVDYAETQEKVQQKAMDKAAGGHHNIGGSNQYAQDNNSNGYSPEPPMAGKEGYTQEPMNH